MLSGRRSSTWNKNLWIVYSVKDHTKIPVTNVVPAFSIDKAVATNALTCEVTVQAKTLINSLHFTWTFFDKDGVKLGQTYPRIENLAVGDKQKLTFTMDEGTAKVVSKPR